MLSSLWSHHFALCQLLLTSLDHNLFNQQLKWCTDIWQNNAKKGCNSCGQFAHLFPASTQPFRHSQALILHNQLKKKRGPKTFQCCFILDGVLQIQHLCAHSRNVLKHSTVGHSQGHGFTFSFVHIILLFIWSSELQIWVVVFAIVVQATFLWEWFFQHCWKWFIVPFPSVPFRFLQNEDSLF